MSPHWRRARVYRLTHARRRRGGARGGGDNERTQMPAHHKLQFHCIDSGIIIYVRPIFDVVFTPDSRHSLTQTIKCNAQSKNCYAPSFSSFRVWFHCWVYCFMIAKLRLLLILLALTKPPRPRDKKQYQLNAKIGICFLILILLVRVSEMNMVTIASHSSHLVRTTALSLVGSENCSTFWHEYSSLSDRHEMEKEREQWNVM